jgi:hypothetical protein
MSSKEDAVFGLGAAPSRELALSNFAIARDGAIFVGIMDEAGAKLVLSHIVA